MNQDEPEWFTPSPLPRTEWLLLWPLRCIAVACLWATWTRWRTVATMCAVLVLLWYFA